jgi:hypothetical protein
MPGDRITLATVPDEATAELLREVLRDGGVEQVDIAAVPGNPYLGRAHALDYEVRVEDVDEKRARQVLADFESESEQAATSQAETPPTHVEDAEQAPLRQRKPFVLWGLIMLGVAMFGPIVFAILRKIFHEYFEQG